MDLISSESYFTRDTREMDTLPPSFTLAVMNSCIFKGYAGSVMLNKQPTKCDRIKYILSVLIGAELSTNLASSG